MLGLLAESECRAAIILSDHGIDTAAVRRSWPALKQSAESAANRVAEQHQVEWLDDAGSLIPRLSLEIETSFSALEDRLFEYPRPLTLRTEHLLLGLVSADHPVGAWLRQQGVDPDTLETEVRQRDGRLLDPLPLDDPLTSELDRPPAFKAAPMVTTAPDTAASTSREVVLPIPQDVVEIRSREQARALRVIDAAANRAREGLRAVEDYVRFVLDDRHLTDQIKQFRHDLAAVLARLGVADLLAARETRTDVGTQLATATERRRRDTAEVLSANFIRLQEALRSLEEFGKVLDPEFGAELKQLRYRAYTLQRAVEITRFSHERLALARLYVLVDGRSSPEEFDELVRSLVEAGVHMIQLRDKRLDDRRLLERARLLREATAASRTLFIMNDRADLATLSQADGVHIGQEELTVRDARAIVGPDALVGVSTHSIEQARAAVMDGANYIGVGPTFPSGTKSFDEFPGVELLCAVANQIGLPAFAVGGICRENLPKVLATGVLRIAVSGAISDAEDPARAAAELLAVLEGG